MCSASSAKRCFTEWADPPFIDTRRDGVHAQGIMEVIVFSPNREGACNTPVLIVSLITS